MRARVVVGFVALWLVVTPSRADDETSAEPRLTLGGALRFNLLWASWDPEVRDEGGRFLFDTFRLNADASWRELRMSAEYRFYAGFSMLHHGYFGWAPSDAFAIDVGVSRVPFGLLPFASHNWFFSLPYYVGLEDDYDLGVKGTFVLRPLEVQLAFYKSDEGSFVGDSLDSARYSYDVVRVAAGTFVGVDPEVPLFVQEVNQLNARVAWSFTWDDVEAELGASAQLGGLYDTASGRWGSHRAWAAHLDVTWGLLHLQLLGLHYRFVPAGGLRTEGFVPMGAYDAPYRVARRAWGLVANVAQRVPVRWWVLEELTLYNDFSWLSKPEPGFADSFQNVLGASLTAGPLLVYLDAAAGRSHPILGPDYVNALAEGSDAGWQLRLNLNAGWYF